MDLKPQDILVALKLAVADLGRSPQEPIARMLGLSTGELSKSLRRLRHAGLVAPGELRTLRAQFLEFVAHGLKYVLPVRRGSLTRGVPTAYAAEPLKDRIVSDPLAPPVWPAPDGSVRGEAWEPLYPSAVFAARQNPKMHQGLALIDAIRGGRARERQIGEECLRELMMQS